MCQTVCNGDKEWQKSEVVVGVRVYIIVYTTYIILYSKCLASYLSGTLLKRTEHWYRQVQGVNRPNKCSMEMFSLSSGLKTIRKTSRLGSKRRI